jgi:5-methyltetrahydrofolate--homocysteine methyltransferase
MQRQGFELPLLIGGATTSPAHTAVKIDPEYAGPVVYVKDASRSVGVAQKLASPDERVTYVDATKAEHAKRRERHAGKNRLSPQLSLAESRENRALPDFERRAPAPKLTGCRTLDIPIAELVDYIDWMPFFNAWEFAGKFPAILEDEIVGEAASALYRDARAMLDQLLAEDWLQARAVVGLFPAVSDGDDLRLFRDAAREEELARLHFLRQQRAMPDGKPNLCLADFIAPVGAGEDWLGGFAVTAGLGADAKVAEFERAHDDYNSILLKALADRFAEAGAEYLHARMRREWWGYATEEQLDNDALIAERYQGIRPAPGYPACPDHTEKATLWRLLNVEKETGIALSESFAMLPAASVSGWYFAHPDARYFSVGKIGADQVEDYARRKGLSVPTVERWLAANLGYDAVAA